MAGMRCRYCGSEVTEGELWNGNTCYQSPNKKHLGATVTEMRCCYCGSKVAEGELWNGNTCYQSPNNKHQLT